MKRIVIASIVWIIAITWMPCYGGPFSHRIDFFGVVRDERGKPVAGAQVLYRAPSGLIAAIKNREKDGGVTRADGRFEILGQKGGGISVRVRHPDYEAIDPLPVGVIYDDPNPTTPDNPAVFILRKKAGSTVP